jgi:hypothetical protein
MPVIALAGIVVRIAFLSIYVYGAYHIAKEYRASKKALRATKEEKANEPD